MSSAKRIFPGYEPYVDPTIVDWPRQGDWDAWWIDHPERPLKEPSVVAFRLRFSVEHKDQARVHVSADNRYRLLLDGEPVGRGPERGDPQHWRFESYELELGRGEHVLIALAWWLGELAPYAQMSVRPGFLLGAEGEWHEALSTGVAGWEAMLMDGISYLPSGMAWGTGAKARIDGERFPWGWESGEVGTWATAEKIIQGLSAAWKNDTPPYWLLTPALLPPMLEEPVQAGAVRFLTDAEAPYPVSLEDHLEDEAGAWNILLAQASPLDIPANSTRTAIIDLQQYYCAYPRLRTSGGKGARIAIRWAESLYMAPEGGDKGNRDEIDRKFFIGVGDEFLPDGGARRDFTTLWWEAGRYLEVTVTTADDPLTLESLYLIETRYPLEMTSKFTSSDDRLQGVIPIGLRGLQMCSHETYMDCPYYEQLMYVGDTRLEVLTTYAITRDERLPRKALTTFHESRRLSGLTQSRYPSRVTQVIPPFSLFWTNMVHDYSMWRDDADFVRGLLPGVRAVLDYFRTLITDDGLMGAPQSWNFADWVPDWHWGIPPDAADKPNALLNAHFVLSLLYKAELEEFFGEKELAQRDRNTASSVFDAVLWHFWDDGRGLLADDLGQKSFSEHTQCLASLTGLLSAEYQRRVSLGLAQEGSLARTTIYFTHYLFEACYALGLETLFFNRLAFWFDLGPRGFKTTPEMPEPSRSDCHAWGAHPIYHYFASVLGIRPHGPGFRQVRIAPMLGQLDWVDGTLPHPDGELTVRIRRDGISLRAQVNLPRNVSGTFAWHGREERLVPGENDVVM